MHIGAKWFPFDEVHTALNFTSSLSDPPPEGYKEGSLRLPPATAIANQLIRAVVLSEFHKIPPQSDAMSAGSAVVQGAGASSKI